MNFEREKFENQMFLTFVVITDWESFGGNVVLTQMNRNGFV